MVLSVQAAQGNGAYSTVISAELKGFVYYADGETPASDIPVRVWDQESREFIFETKTDENGFFQLPKLEPGNYYLTYDWLKLEIQVLPDSSVLVQQPHDVVVVIPRGLGIMSIGQMSTILTASMITEAARLYEQEDRLVRPSVVSP